MPTSMATYKHEDWYEVERLHRAADDGDLAEIERLVAAGYDVNLFDDMGRTPLHYAAVGGRLEAIVALLGHGALVNANDEATISETPLALAVQETSVDAVRLLLNAGADPDIVGWMGNTARSRACSRRDATGGEMCRLISASSTTSRS